MDYCELVEEFKRIIAPILESNSVELVDLNFLRPPGRPILKLLVDKKEGVINLQECAKLNKTISQALDAGAEDIVQSGYILEVSSPGLDRPLRTTNDFSRCINRKVIFFLSEPINGKIEWKGIIVKTENDSVYVDADGNIFNIPLVKIKKAKQLTE